MSSAAVRVCQAVRVRVCVFTGSASGRSSHREAVAALGADLAAAGVGVVYGGGQVGLMGVVADAALAAGGEVIGVMPQPLVDGEIAHPGLTRLDVVADMHQRKARMAELADAFVALPGGAGTLEELFEVWTWGQLGLHTKPTALMNVDGFSAQLLEQLDVMQAEGYLGPTYRQSLGVVSDAAALLGWIKSYQHPPAKWSVSATASSAGHEQPTLRSVGWVQVVDGRLLAVRSTGRDRFYLPGGKPETGETLEQAVAREVREELGVELSCIRPAFTIQAPAHGLLTPHMLTMHCFYAAAHGRPQPAREIAELAWLEIPADERAAPALAEVLRRLD